MAGKGGYQAPMNPAPVSGPGALSQRTDGGPADQQAAQYVSGLPYGEGQAFMATQQAAPMAASGMMPEPAPIVPLNAPSIGDGIPVTHGADAGAGPGMASLGLPNPDVTSYQSTRDYIHALAQNSNASPALKFLAQRINGAF
jgi:hypothetical protein